MVKVEGDLDIKNSDELLKELIKIEDSGKFRIVLDLGLVNFISSSGLGVIAATLARLQKNGGALKLVSLTPGVRKMFEVVKLIKRFEIYESSEDAVKNFIE